MRSLREYAQFVGKPEQPISPRTLTDYLHLNIDPHAFSLREMIQAFETVSEQLAIGTDVQPKNAIVPFQIGMQMTSQHGYVIALRWRILRGGQEIAHYDYGQNGFFPQAAHTFTEAGSYTVEARAKGIGKDGYGEVSQSVAVVANANQPLPPPPPPAQNNKLKLVLGQTELVPNTLRIISANWKVTPFWNSSQVFNLTGAEAEVSLPNPPLNADARVSVELRIRCAVAGVLNGASFQYQEFDGLVEPLPAIVGLEGKPLTAGWAAFWNLGQVNDGDDNPNNDPIAVVVVARLVSIL